MSDRTDRIVRLGFRVMFLVFIAGFTAAVVEAFSVLGMDDKTMALAMGSFWIGVLFCKWQGSVNTK